ISFSTAKASINGSSVVPGLPNTISTPSCFKRSRKARFPVMTGTGRAPGALERRDGRGPRVAGSAPSRPPCRWTHAGACELRSMKAGAADAFPVRIAHAHMPGSPCRTGGAVMHPLRLSIVPLALAVSAMAAHADPLAPEDAGKHVGEKATVCGLVAAAKYAAQSGGRPTFLDFGKPYPDTIFTALIL